MNAMLDTLLLDDSSGILLLVDPASLAIRAANNPGLRLLGYQRENLLGRPITEIECSLADSFYWEEVRQGGPTGLHNAEANYLCANGEILLASKTVSHVSGHGENWLVVRAEPLIAQKRVEDELSSVASLLRATLEATADGILLIDRAGAIVNMNQRFSRMWELPQDTLLSHQDGAIFEFMAGRFSDRNAYQSALAEIAPDGEDETFDLLHLADGRFFERKSIPARHGSRILGRVFSFNDITARKRVEFARSQLEAQLRESQKMEAIGTLAGGIAHDFNNIIATILGNAELAHQDIGSNPLARESVGEIRKAARRARDLVQQILSFSRRQATERTPLALAPIIEESTRLLRSTLPARVALEVRCEEVPAVLADATQIEQIVLNLATNSMQAMHGRPGRIAIHLDTVMLDNGLAAEHAELREMHDRLPGRTVRLTVSDNGSGMDEATLARIFEPFFTTKAVDEGTGLGLSVVHGIVQAHEGAITVESAPEKGTSFTLYLPSANADDAPVSAIKVGGNESPGDSAKAASHESGIAQRILYLDDDESLVFLVKRLLERSGYRVAGHTDQHRALDDLRSAPDAFDLVLTDYNMPGMSGLDIAREVRAIRTDLPVAIASGFIDEALRAQASEAGIRELIFKASAVEEFCATVQRLARSVAENSKLP